MASPSCKGVRQAENLAKKKKKRIPKCLSSSPPGGSLKAGDKEGSSVNSLRRWERSRIPVRLGLQSRNRYLEAKGNSLGLYPSQELECWSHCHCPPDLRHLPSATALSPCDTLVAVSPVVLFHYPLSQPSVHAVDERTTLAYPESPPRDSGQGMGLVPGSHRAIGTPHGAEGMGLVPGISQGNRNPSRGRSAGSHLGS